MIFTLFALSITFGIVRFVSNELKSTDVYETLSKKQTEAVFQLPLDVVKLNMNADEIISRIKQIPGVENTVITVGFSSENIYHNITLSNGVKFGLLTSTFFEGYNQFFELKNAVSGTSLAPGEVIVNEKLAAFLQQNNVTEFDTYFGKCKIVGTIKDIPYVKLNQYAVLVSPANSYGKPSCLIKCHPNQTRRIKKKILKIIREYVPETIPYRIHTLSDATNLYSIVFKSISTAMWLASVMCLIITLLGIYTAVTTDTRRRKREIAIRKINGATYRDIILQFIKLYAIMLIVALVVSIPLNCAILTMMQIPINSLKDGLINTFPTWCVIAAFVYLTIFRLIRQAAKKNPAEVIKAE